MRFRVRRGGQPHDAADAPCAGAVRWKRERLATGATEYYWTLDVPDLDALGAFAVRYGAVVVSPPDADDPTYFRLRICDQAPEGGA